MKNRHNIATLTGLAALVVILGSLSLQAAMFKKPKAAPTPPVVAAPPVVTNPPAPVVADVAPTNAPEEKPVIVWDATSKDLQIKVGEPAANFEFTFTNVSKVPVVLTVVHPSCGCTTASLPPLPWTNAPGADGTIKFSINLAGKSGTLFKTVNVDSTAGHFTLQLKAVLPDPAVARKANMELAQGDRQAVFKGDCISCHVTPTIGKMGGELYKVACGICHDAEHRATMVADLHQLKHPTDRDYWKTWTTFGKPGSLMPAFSHTQGGPLSDEQIESLADYLATAIPSKAEDFSGNGATPVVAPTAEAAPQPH